jgi:hypothetical protein
MKAHALGLSILLGADAGVCVNDDHSARGIGAPGKGARLADWENPGRGQDRGQETRGSGITGRP